MRLIKIALFSGRYQLDVPGAARIQDTFLRQEEAMTKLKLINNIRRLNRSATRQFLVQFDENDLGRYLRRLLRLRRLRGSDNLLKPLSASELFG